MDYYANGQMSMFNDRFAMKCSQKICLTCIDNICSSKFMKIYMYCFRFLQEVPLKM